MEFRFSLKAGLHCTPDSVAHTTAGEVLGFNLRWEKKRSSDRISKLWV